LRGTCLELLPLCKGFCCRVYKIIPISVDEYQSGLYDEVDIFCSLSEKQCTNNTYTCIYRNFLLKRKEDGSCIYQNSSNKCRIQEHKPGVCRNFSCQGGWRLTSVFPLEGQNKSFGTKIEKEDFIERLRDEMIFILHPLLKLHTVFYLKTKEEIIFVKEMIGMCGKFNTRETFHHPQLDDDLLIALINLFGSKDTLKDIRERFCDQQTVNLTKKEFYEIVWLLNKHNIILETRNLGALLSGVGRI
jgi:Fe-S-cluster containining protein